MIIISGCSTYLAPGGPQTVAASAISATVDSHQPEAPSQSWAGEATIPGTQSVKRGEAI